MTAYPLLACVLLAIPLGLGAPAVTGAAAPGLAAPPGAPGSAIGEASRRPAPASSQIPLKLVRFGRSSGPVLVSGAVPLQPGALRPGQGSLVRVLVGGAEQAAYVEPLRATHRDGSVASVLVQFRHPGAGETVLDIGTPSRVPRMAPRPEARGAAAAAAVPVSADYLVSTQIVGPAVTVRDADKLTPAIRKYDSDFTVNAERRWSADGAKWDAANYYDRAMIYYVWWARTGDARYLERAHAIALDYRKNYLEANNYGASAHWMMPDGVALHYLLTGDEASRVAIGRLADNMAYPYYMNNLHDPDAEMDNRVQARVLTAFVLAHRIKAPTREGNDWAARARQALPKILASQSPDGAYRFAHLQCRNNKPFMVGLLNDALIRYYTEFEPDPRIVPAVKRSLDYMWAKDWRPRERAFTYLEGYCGTRQKKDEWGAPTPAPDVSNLIVNGYAWYARHSGNRVYRDRADQIFEGAVAGAWLQGSKQFNQQYAVAHRYIAYRTAQ